MCPAFVRAFPLITTQSSQSSYAGRDEDQKQVTELGSCVTKPTACTTGSCYHNAHLGRGRVRQAERMNTERQAHKISPETGPMILPERLQAHLGITLAPPTFFREVVLFGLLVHLAAPAFQPLRLCLEEFQEPVAIPAAGPWLSWLCWGAGGGLQPRVGWGQRRRLQGRVAVVSIGEVALDLGNLGGLSGASVNADGVGV